MWRKDHSLEEFSMISPLNDQPGQNGLLSMISQVHDVLGLVQPFILPGRKLLQEACRDQTGWMIRCLIKFSDNTKRVYVV